jgi:hypothetical protein
LIHFQSSSLSAAYTAENFLGFLATRAHTLSADYPAENLPRDRDSYLSQLSAAYVAETATVGTPPGYPLYQPPAYVSETGRRPARRGFSAYQSHPSKRGESSKTNFWVSSLFLSTPYKDGGTQSWRQY